MNGKKVPSHAQAKRIAALWSGSGPVEVMTAAGPARELYVDATTKVLVSCGWLKPTERTKVSNGYTFTEHFLTSDAIDALEFYFFKQRCDRTTNRLLHSAAYLIGQQEVFLHHWKNYGAPPKTTPTHIAGEM